MILSLIIGFFNFHRSFASGHSNGGTSIGLLKNSFNNDITKYAQHKESTNILYSKCVSPRLTHQSSRSPFSLDNFAHCIFA